MVTSFQFIFIKHLKTNYHLTKSNELNYIALTSTPYRDDSRKSQI